MRRRLLMLGGSTIASTIAAVAIASGQPGANAAAGSVNAPPTTVAGLTETQVMSIAIQGATAAGDPKPTDIAHSTGTRAQANLLAAGETVPGDQPSLLIVEHGRFIASNAPTPPGAPAPTGTVLTLVVDQATGQVTDTGIQGSTPDLHELGAVTTDLGNPPS